MDRRSLGQAGERLAADYLLSKGFRVIDRNWTTSSGEIDLVMGAPDGSVVFVEVRARRGEAAGDEAAASVDARKQARLWNLAEEYLAEHDLTIDARIDVVAVAVDQDGRLAEVRHIENAVQGA